MDIMSTLPNNYWTALLSASETTYQNALVVVGTDSHYDKSESVRVVGVRFTNYTNDFKLQDRATDVKSQWDFNRYYNKRVVIVPRDVYNQLLRDIKTNNKPTINIDEYAKGTAPVSELKNKNVFIVWNKTTAQFVRAVGTAGEADTLAREMATKNTNQAFLVLRPDSVAYQPVSITVDKVKIDE